MASSDPIDKYSTNNDEDEGGQGEGTDLAIGNLHRSATSFRLSTLANQPEQAALPAGQHSLPSLDALPPIKVPEVSSVEHPNLVAFGGTRKIQGRSGHKRSNTRVTSVSTSNPGHNTGISAEELQKRKKDIDEGLAAVHKAKKQVEKNISDRELERAINNSLLVMNSTGGNQNIIGDSGSSISNNLNQAQRPNSSSGHNAHNQQQVNGNSQAAMSSINAVPTNAGYQMDLNHVMTTLNELSEQLKINREQSSSIVDKVAEVRRRAAAEGTAVSIQQMNGELNGPGCDHESTIIALRKENKLLIHELFGERKLRENYEDGITRITSMVRNSVYDRTNAHLNIHKFYMDLLAAEREVTMNERFRILEIQERLTNVLGMLRHVKGEHDDQLAVHIREIASWKYEALALRKIVYRESYEQGIDPMDGEGEDDVVPGDEGVGGMGDEGQGKGDAKDAEEKND